MIDDFDCCYRAVQSRDPRFDGVFFVGVTSTGIYCRPSCPATTPKPRNCTFHASAASAQRAGFRACKRCRPDAVPGSPEWEWRGDVVGRALRLVADGVVDREGVPGLARRLHYSERQLERILMAEVGAGPLALARAQRARTARILIETTTMRIADVAFASGFASVRQFSDTIREVFASSPSELRARARLAAPAGGPREQLVLRLPARAPFAVADLFGFLGARSIPGVEHWDVATTTYTQALRLPHGDALATLRPMEDAAVQCVLACDDLRDLMPAVARLRRLADLDADPVAIDDQLREDEALAPLVRATPGRRVPGVVDGFELAVRAVVGQQVSVSGARTIVGRIVDRVGESLDRELVAGVGARTFPTAAAIAAADLSGIGMPGARIRTVQTLARSVAEGAVELGVDADRDEARARLVALPGIGPWTAEYVAMRALGDPDAFPSTDLGVLRSARGLGITDLDARAARWSPWRAYAVMHLWSVPIPPRPVDKEPR